MRPRPIFPLLVCLWPILALGQTQSTSTKDSEPPKQNSKQCVSTEAAQEVLRLGRNLGYPDDQIVEAYGQDPCGTLSYLREQSQQKGQPTSTEDAIKSGYVKCQNGAREVSVWLAPGKLTAVASPRCGEKLDILQDGESPGLLSGDLWMRVRTQDGKVGYIPRAAVSDSPDSVPVPPPAQEQTQATKQASEAGQVATSCDKVVSFALADASGVHPFMGTGNWIGNWIRKNGKKYPDICFSQTPLGSRKNYLVAISQAPGYLTGFDPVVRTNTSTSTSPVSGSGTATDNYGDMWNYTYNGTVTTTTTTTTNENVPYTINSNTIYTNAYDQHGTLVSQHSHVYSTKSGGDDANSFGYNMGNALAAINARGRLLQSVVKDIEGRK